MQFDWHLRFDEHRRNFSRLNWKLKVFRQEYTSFHLIFSIHTVSGENADDEWRTWEIPASGKCVSNKFIDSRTKGSVIRRNVSRLNDDHVDTALLGNSVAVSRVS